MAASAAFLKELRRKHGLGEFKRKTKGQRVATRQARRLRRGARRGRRTIRRLTRRTAKFFLNPFHLPSKEGVVGHSTNPSGPLLLRSMPAVPKISEMDSAILPRPAQASTSSGG